MILSLCFILLECQNRKLGDNVHVLVDSVGAVYIQAIFILGGGKELGCFYYTLLREDKKGNKGVNQKTLAIKFLFTPYESLTLFCFKNMLGIHLIFTAHPLPYKPSAVHG